MSSKLTKSLADLSSKIDQSSSLIFDLLLPSMTIAETCNELGYEFRERVYTPMVTVWMLITQMLSADHSCQQAVTKLNAWRTQRGFPRVSSETTSYCKARGRLPEKLFERLLMRTATACDEASDKEWQFHGREVRIVDGTTVTMDDTDENQKEYPQPRSQKPGCGFPMARLVMVFSLATGAVIAMASGPCRGKLTGESSLLRKLLDVFFPGDIVLADRYFASFWMLVWGETRKIDVVARAHQHRKIDFRRGLKQGYCDQLVSYPKPQRPSWMTTEEYAGYPDWILVRHLRYRVTQQGFRTREITLATTLLDASVYTAEDLAALYCRRWLVELHIRSLKTHMQMEHIRCKSPSMVRKAIHCHLIAYNLVRSAMLASALRFDLCPSRLSFTGAMQALEELASALRLGQGKRADHWDNLLATISELQVGDRAGRIEPRTLKRRKKSYNLMTTPRNGNATLYATAA